MKKIFAILLFAVLVVITAIAILNWDSFITPTELSLGLTTAQIPLGLVMLGLVVLLAAIFLVYVVYLQSSALLETRRHTKELQANRELADQAEASRFTALRSYLEAELANQSKQRAESKAEMLARIALVDNNLHTMIEQSGNTLAAYIGELEDRLEKNKDASAREVG